MGRGGGGRSGGTFAECLEASKDVEGIKAVGAGRTGQDSNLGTTTIIESL